MNDSLNEHTQSVRITWRPLVALLAFALLGSPACVGSGGNGIVIHDYATRKTAGTVPMGYFREMIHTEARPQGAFFTMTQEASQLIIRKRDPNGAEVSRKAMPLVESVWHSPGWCALDDSGVRLAYFDDKTKSLRVRNLSTGTVSDIPSPSIDSIVSIRLFSWTGSDTLLLLVSVPDKDYSMEVSRINIRTKSIQTKPINLESSPVPRLSPDRKWFAGKIWAGENILIFDSASLTKKVTIPRNDTESRTNGLLWSSDSEWLFHSIRSNQGDRAALYRQNLMTKATEELPVPDKKGILLMGSLGDTITAFGCENNKTWLLDTGERVWRDIGHSNGSIYGIQGTTRYAVTQ